MGLFGSISGGQKTVASTTSVDNSQVNQDNKVAVQTGTVQTTAGGALTDQKGAVVNSGAGSVTISSVDPGSYAFASDVYKAATQSNADVFSTAGLALGKATDTVKEVAASAADSAAKLAQGTPLGIDWKTLLVPLALVALAAVWLFRRGRA